MTRIRSYGPSLALAVMIAGVLLGGPHVVRQLAYAQQEVEIRQVRENLQENSPLAALSNAFRDVARVVEPSVVHISVSRTAPDPSRRGRGLEDFPGIPEDFRRFFEGRPSPDEEEQQTPPPEEQEQYQRPQIPFGNGSGWVYPDGEHIITNYHVVRDADRIEVQFNDRATARAEVVGSDPQTDIAVLRLRGNRSLHPAEMAPETVDRGDIVFAFGSPFGFEFSMSQGIVSGKGRQIGILAARGGYENFIQTDAAINQGNSGGPLTNYYGQVVGMNTAIATETGGNMGIGFAIPAEMIVQVVDQLIEHGQVRRGYLGIYLPRDDSQDVLRRLGFDGQGVLVEDLVTDDSPAAQAGIEAGDIVTSVDGFPVRNASQLRRRVATYPPGETIDITIFRDGEERTVQVTLGEQPQNVGPPTPRRPQPEQEQEAEPSSVEELRQLGVEEVSSFTRERAEELGVGFQPGVLIEGVRSGSIAAAEGLRRGIVILEVERQPVSSVTELAEVLDGADLTEGVLMRVQTTDGLRRFVVLTLPDD